jgi:hypothetical protein
VGPQRQRLEVHLAAGGQGRHRDRYDDGDQQRPEEHRRGEIKGYEITFTRDNGQEYRGFLLADDPTGKANKQAMAGLAKSGDAEFAWYATR